MSRAKRKRIAALHRKQRRRLARVARDALFTPFGLAAVAAFAFGKAQKFLDAPAPASPLSSGEGLTKLRARLRRLERKPYEAPRVVTFPPGPMATELLAKLEQSGMRRLNCEACGCEMLTRGEVNKCPPCRGIV